VKNGHTVAYVDETEEQHICRAQLLTGADAREHALLGLSSVD
jgi:hypothetical protein